MDIAQQLEACVCLEIIMGWVHPTFLDWDEPTSCLVEWDRFILIFYLVRRMRYVGWMTI